MYSFIVALCLVSVVRPQLTENSNASCSIAYDSSPRLSFQLSWQPLRGPPGPPGPPGVLQSSQEIERINDTMKSLQKLTEMLKKGHSFMSGRAYLFGKKASSWQVARDFCRSKGGDLVSKAVRDRDDFKWIVEEAKIRGKLYCIGLKYLAQEKSYKFVDGVKALTSDFYWTPGQPDKTGSCMTLPYLGGVDNIYCAGPCFPLCEIEI